jgi:hypothetical protein
MELEGKLVKVYRNLHKNCFSIVDAKTGRVISHEDSFTLRDAVFRIQPAGQRKVRIEKKKNVHAYVKGVYTSGNQLEGELVTVSYNPYLDDHFRLPGGIKVLMSDCVYFADGKSYISKN